MYRINGAIGSLNLNEDNYKTMSVYPSTHELVHPSTKNIPQNIVTGSYGTIYNYLHTHFFLLREDFIKPIREDIIAFLKGTSEAELSNIKIHTVKCTRKGVRDGDICFCFNIIKKSKINDTLKDPKRFMTGSLLIFSRDNFKNSFCGRVADKITDNKLLVSFELPVNLWYEEKIRMIECNTFFEPYFHVMKALKNMPQARLPMQNYLVYASPAVKKTPYLFYQSSISDPQLNSAQLAALNGALSRELAIVQGPPGTGKTFLGLKIAKKLLTMNPHPLLIISVTNHALDQFLAGLIDATDKILRYGGQSKNSKMEKYTLKECRNRYYNSSPSNFQSKQAVGRVFRELKKIEEKIKAVTDQLDFISSRRHTGVVDFTKFKAKITLDDLEYPSYLKTKAEIDRYETILKQKMDSLIEVYQPISEDFKELVQTNNINVWRYQRVIGMTTTSAARLHDTIRAVQCPIVIVEEAAEALEAHIIPLLTEHCQHLILLGDHQQLKPSAADHEIETEYNLGVSLFERMVKNNIPYHALNVQYRMRPEISSLVTPSIYPVLHNHDSVRQFPRIRGVQKSLYFITHNVPEQESNDSSKKNVHEAKFFIKLAEYLLKTGYKPEEITILTPYLGQVEALEQEKVRTGQANDVKIMSVDGFQGEESRIILLSLVRSNPRRKIGFLEIENRICVALTRAREGMYIIGNMTLLSSVSKLWRKIKHTLQDQESLGSSLPLINKLGLIIRIAKAEDFDKFVPNGGYKNICNNTLSCGHRCRLLCHYDNSQHTGYICKERCLRIVCKLCTKQCSKRCYEECEKCTLQHPNVTYHTNRQSTYYYNDNNYYNNQYYRDQITPRRETVQKKSWWSKCTII